jgi:DNA invertase Pin-like site-specific DNA recombinase
MTFKPLLYSYIRFSTTEQAKGQSLSRQMSYAREVAKEKGLELDESLTMHDLGVSAFHGNNVKKGALGLFLVAVEQGKIPTGSILVIESLDRISRGAITDCNSIVTQIINAGITVITAIDNKEYNKMLLDKTPFELFAMLMIFIRANEESETKSIRVRSALTAQCEKWLAGSRDFRVKCGKAPKWVNWDDANKKFVIERIGKAIMMRKIELFRQGYGGLKIAELLNREFGAGTVHHTGANVYKEVKRRSLVGELNVKVGEKKFVLENYYPALLTHDEFNSLIADSSNRGAVKHSQKFVGILSGIGLFKCGQCRKSVGSHVVYRKKQISDVKSSHKRYGCVEARRNNNCVMNYTVQVDVVEKAVVRFCQDKVNLQRILLKGSDIDAITDDELRLIAQLEKVEQDIETLKSLEVDATNLKSKITANKHKLTKINNSHKDEVTERWLSFTENLSVLGGDKRLEIRQLVKDTFKSIRLQVYGKKGSELSGLESLIDAHMMGDDSHNNCFELTLEFYNDKKRLLRLDKHSGVLLAGFDL